MSRHASPSDTLAAPRAVPKTMRAAVIERFGGPEALVLREVAVPQPGPDDILIEVHIAGVGEWDAWHREGGDAPPQPRFPLVLGTDGAGIVAARGARVRHLAEGDAVYAYDYERRGFYAEYVAVSQRHAGPIPSSLALAEAGAIACIGLTALQGIDDQLVVKQGEAAAVHGASGAVGHLAVQFARLRGASRRKASTSSSPSSAARRSSICSPRCEGARVAWPNGIEPEPRRRPGIEFLCYDATPDTDEFARLTRAVEAAQLKVHIGAAFPLAQAAQAHQRLAAGHVLGKMVLRA